MIFVKHFCPWNFVIFKIQRFSKLDVKSKEINLNQISWRDLC